MQWITLQPGDVNEYLDLKQLDALRNHALTNGEADPLVEIIGDVAERIRAEIRGCASNRVSTTGGEIPPSLKSAAIALIIEAVYMRLPGLALNNEQRDAADNARKYLARIAACEVPVAAPDDPEEPDGMQRGLRVQTVTSRKTRVTSERMRGLT